MVNHRVQIVLPDGTRIYTTVPLFPEYTAPYGFLEHDIECHALFYYAVIARHNYEMYVLDNAIEYEGSPTIISDFRRLFESTACHYGVSAETMAKHWPCINMQFMALGLPQLPDEERYRFNTPLIIQ